MTANGSEVSDRDGSEGTDFLIGVETAQFADVQLNDLPELLANGLPDFL